MKMNKTVCNCYNVTIQDVKDAIDKGAANLDEVKEATSAATCCGACEEYLTSIVNEFLGEK
jgi:bacterioferritin-associated ferredoxin